MATAKMTAFKRKTTDGPKKSREELAAESTFVDIGIVARQLGAGDDPDKKTNAERNSQLQEMRVEDEIGWVDINAVFPLGSEEIIIDKNAPSKGQPRQYFDPVKLQELADNIKQFGQKQPLLVRRVKSRHASRKWEYGIIAGERRWHAMKFHLGAKEVLVRVQDLDKRRSFREAMIDDLTSEKFTPGERGLGLVRVFKEMEEELLEYLEGADLEKIETAWTQKEYDRLISRWDGKVPMHIQEIVERAIKTKRTPKVAWEDIADVYGLGRRQIFSYISLAKLPEKMIEAVNEGKVTVKHAESLLTLKNEIDRTALFKKILRENLSAAEAAEEAKKLRGKAGPQRTESLSTYMKRVVESMEKAADAPAPEAPEEREELRGALKHMLEWAAKIEARLAE